MLLTSERVSPWSARLRRSSSGRVTTTSSPSRAIVISSGAWISSSPFGPLTAIRRPSLVTSTPLGITMGFLPTRDMVLPDLTEDLAADLALARLAVGEQTLVGGQDRDPHAAEDPRDLVGGAVDAQPGLGHAADAGDRAA